MGTEETKDPLKGVDWKAIGGELQKDPSAGGKPVIKKRLPKKIRQIPDCYFLPRMSVPSAIAFYGACIAGGIGAGMLLEVWINKKIKGIPEDIYLLSFRTSEEKYLFTLCKAKYKPRDMWHEPFKLLLLSLHF